MKTLVGLQLKKLWNSMAIKQINISQKHLMRY